MNSKLMGERLKKLRIDNNKSQEEVARDLKISLSAYTKYESGLRTPRDEVKILLAGYFNVSIQELFFT